MSGVSILIYVAMAVWYGKDDGFLFGALLLSIALILHLSLARTADKIIDKIA